jgi:hypothetical protein
MNQKDIDQEEFKVGDQLTQTDDDPIPTFLLGLLLLYERSAYRP